jgi:hypothetical protein
MKSILKSRILMRLKKSLTFIVGMKSYLQSYHFLFCYCLNLVKSCMFDFLSVYSIYMYFIMKNDLSILFDINCMHDLYLLFIIFLVISLFYFMIFAVCYVIVHSCGCLDTETDMYITDMYITDNNTLS